MDPKLIWFNQGELEKFPWHKTEEGTNTEENRNVGESLTLYSCHIHQENQNHVPFTKEFGYVLVSGESPPKKAEFSDCLL